GETAARPAEPATGASPPVPVWERRAVAILAIELAFLEASGDAQREPWTAMARWRRLVEEKVSRLAALFGAPLALEQAPERAVEAALAIMNLTESAELPRPERRIAIHLGAV